MRRLISGLAFRGEAGYSRAVVDGEWVFVAGTTGFDYAQMTIAEDPAEQARRRSATSSGAGRGGRQLAMSCGCTTTCPTRDWPRSCRCWAKFRAIRPAATALSAASSTRA